MDEMGRAARNPMRDWLREGRSVFGPVFRSFREHGVARPWDETLDELYDEGHIGRMIADLLHGEGLEPRLPDAGALAGIPYRQLPGTACWVEYYTALAYMAAEEPGRASRPDLGDQADFRHAAYAGVVDVFVTDDGKMLHALGELVPSVRATVLTADEFLDRYAERPADN
jgi:hypothetical protein